jgi:hypothetical protein
VGSQETALFEIPGAYSARLGSTQGPRSAKKAQARSRHTTCLDVVEAPIDYSPCHPVQPCDCRDSSVVSDKLLLFCAPTKYATNLCLGKSLWKMGRHDAGLWECWQVANTNRHRASDVVGQGSKTARLRDASACAYSSLIGVGRTRYQKVTPKFNYLRLSGSATIFNGSVPIGLTRLRTQSHG